MIVKILWNWFSTRKVAVYGMKIFPKSNAEWVIVNPLLNQQQLSNKLTNQPTSLTVNEVSYQPTTHHWSLNNQAAHRRGYNL